MKLAAIALGSNLSFQELSPKLLILRALDELSVLPQTRLLAKSRLYLTEAVDCEVGGRFVNAAAILQTELAPQNLLSALLHLEAKFGRERSFVNAPRTLDLDLLMMLDEDGQSVVLNIAAATACQNNTSGGQNSNTLNLDKPALILPHPRMYERAFVLAPLAEIAENWRAFSDKNIAQSLQLLDQTGLALLEEEDNL